MNEVRVSFGSTNWTITAVSDDKVIRECLHSYHSYWVYDYVSYRTDVDTINETICENHLMRDSLKSSFDVDYLKTRQATRFMIHNFRYHGINRECRQLVNKLLRDQQKRVMLVSSGSYAEDLYTMGASSANYSELRLSSPIELLNGDQYTSIIYVLLTYCQKEHRIEFLNRLAEMPANEMNWVLRNLNEECGISPKTKNILHSGEIDGFYETFLELSNSIPKCVRLYPFDSDINFDELPNIPTTELQWVACNALEQINRTMCYNVRVTQVIAGERDIVPQTFDSNGIDLITYTHAINLPDQLIKFYNQKINRIYDPSNNDVINKYQDIHGLLLNIAQYIKDGHEIYRKYAGASIKFNKICGSMVRRLQNAYYNHNAEIKLGIEEKIKLLNMNIESDLMTPPSHKLPRSLEKCRIKTKLELITTAKLLKNCAGTRTENGNVFFRKGNVLAEVNFTTKRLVEVRDFHNSDTKSSLRFAKYLMHKLGLEGNKYIHADLEAIYGVREEAANLAVEPNVPDVPDVHIVHELANWMPEMRNEVVNQYRINGYDITELGYTYNSIACTSTMPENVISVPIMTWKEVPSDQQRSSVMINTQVFPIKPKPNKVTRRTVTTRPANNFKSITIPVLNGMRQCLTVNGRCNVDFVDRHPFSTEQEMQYCVMIGRKRYLGVLKLCNVLIKQDNGGIMISGGVMGTAIFIDQDGAIPAHTDRALANIEQALAFH